MRQSAAFSRKCSIPAGEKISNTLVGSVPRFEGWWTTPHGITINEPDGGRKSTLCHPYSQLPIKDVEGLLVIAVEVRQGPGDRAGIMLSWT
jgi:hypothetical protein